MVDSEQPVSLWVTVVVLLQRDVEINLVESGDVFYPVQDFWVVQRLTTVVDRRVRSVHDVRDWPNTGSGLMLGTRIVRRQLGRILGSTVILWQLRPRNVNW